MKNSKTTYIIVSLWVVLAILLGHVVAIVFYTNNFGWPALNYHIGYETGFGGRKFMGTICHFLFPQYVQIQHIRTLIIVANAMLICLLAWALKKVIQQASHDKTIAIILLLYLVGPFSIVSWFTSGMSVIFMETYQMILLLLWVILYLQWHGKTLFHVFTLIISVICCLIHHTFCCTLFPIIMTMLIYDTLSEQGTPSKKNIIWASIICICMIFILFMIWFYSHMNISQEELSSLLCQRAAPDTYNSDPYVLQMLYYESNSNNRAIMYNTLITQRLPELAFSILILSPLLVVLYFPILYAARKAPSRIRSWKYRIMYLTITIPPLTIFFMATDYGRWFSCWILCLLFLTLILLARHDSLIEKATLTLYYFFKRNYWFLLLLIVYLLSFHIQSFEGLTEAIKMRSFLFG